MTLALFGGEPVRRQKFPSRLTFHLSESEVVGEILNSSELSGFLAEPGSSFNGGPYVRALERAWRARFGSPFVVSMNSGTSALFAATRAVVDPGDEVIVTPWSMSASATCALAAGATPVFVDIEPQTYGLDPAAVEQAITAKTTAIVVVDLFGTIPVGFPQLREIADAHNLNIIEDAAQAVGARDGVAAGTLGDVGVYSLNWHKVIQCGEGGLAVTYQSEICERLRDYRNHGEVRGGEWGGNYRLGEISAGIANVQLAGLDEVLAPRVAHAERITKGLADLDGIVLPHVPAGAASAWYLYPIRLPGVSAPRFAEALRYEGIPAQTYVSPRYRLDVFAKPDLRLPEVEAAWRETVVLSTIYAGVTEDDVDDVVDAVRKVYYHRSEL